MTSFRCDVIFFNQIWVSKITGTASAMQGYGNYIGSIVYKKQVAIEISDENNQVSNKVLSK